MWTTPDNEFMDEELLMEPILLLDDDPRNHVNGEPGSGDGGVAGSCGESGTGGNRPDVNALLAILLSIINERPSNNGDGAPADNDIGAANGDGGVAYGVWGNGGNDGEKCT